MKISFNKPYLGKEEERAVIKVLRSGWITSAKKGEEFEKMFADFVGAKHCVFVNSATSGLNMCVEWYKKKYGIKKVLVPSMTFVATVQAVENAGIEPVFGEIDRNGLLDSNVEKKYDAVIPVHLFGDMARTKWSVPCIEDSAHLVKKNQCKNNNNLVVFSMYSTKNITSGEGGMIATNSKEFYLWAKKYRHHSVDRCGYERYGNNKWKYDVKSEGRKYNNSDILAAIGIEQLKKYDIIHAERKRCIDLYNKLLGTKNTGLHLMPIFVNKRTKFIKIMNDNGISCSVHFLPIHRFFYFKNKYKVSLPITEWMGRHVLSLPLFPALKDREIRYICKKVLETGLLIKK
jgi:perosamine synthetase